MKVEKMSLLELSELHEMITERARVLFKKQWTPLFAATKTKPEFRKVHLSLQESVYPHQSLCNSFVMWEADAFRVRCFEKVD